MKYWYIAICIGLIYFNCSLNSDKRQGTESQSEIDEYKAPYSDQLLEFEGSFGSEISGTESEFLLKSPFGTEVSDRGDIYVIDEWKMKIFDQNGNGIKTIGRRGEGPGEFSGLPYIYVSPTNYLFSYSSLEISKPFNIFAPDFSLVHMKRLRNEQISKIKIYL
ncbi:6-bladed beta-propeller, partial [candidate division KSB1 bacterium]